MRYITPIVDYGKSSIHIGHLGTRMFPIGDYGDGIADRAFPIVAYGNVIVQTPLMEVYHSRLWECYRSNAINVSLP